MAHTCKDYMTHTCRGLFGTHLREVIWHTPAGDYMARLQVLQEEIVSVVDPKAFVPVYLNATFMKVPSAENILKPQ
jgi:hypothetical protein